MKKSYELKRAPDVFSNPWVFKLSMWELHKLRRGVGDFAKIYEANLKVYEAILDAEANNKQDGLCDDEYS